MKIHARRGVCIGVDRHLQAGDFADLDAGQVTFLVSIGAVELIKDEPVLVRDEEAEKTDDDARPAPSGSMEPQQKSIELDTTPAPGKSGKKEK